MATKLAMSVSSAELASVSTKELTLMVEVLVPMSRGTNSFRLKQVTVWKQEVSGVSEASDIAGQVRYANSNEPSMGKIFGVYTERTEV